MNDIARQLRNQKFCSTDPGYLERMALEIERRGLAIRLGTRPTATKEGVPDEAQRNREEKR
jgi:hypothetical protein